jgi:hypothetical protein
MIETKKKTTNLREIVYRNKENPIFTKEKFLNLSAKILIF